MQEKSDFMSRRDTSDDTTQEQRGRQLPGAACDQCRRRKLRCDRQKPQCGACETSGISCRVPDTKLTRGPKRGHLKTMQERIAALEEALQEQRSKPSNPPPVEDPSIKDTPDAASNIGDIGNLGGDVGEMGDTNSAQLSWPLDMLKEGDTSSTTLPLPYHEKVEYSPLDIDLNWFASPHSSIDAHSSIVSPIIPNMACPSPFIPSGSQTPANSSGASDDSIRIAIPSLVQSDLDQLYIDRIHPFVPIVHHGRYAAWNETDLDSLTEAQTALRYAMWTLAAASASAYHTTLRDLLYHRTRQFVESLDQRSGSNDIVDTELVQAWLLLSSHELMCVGFRRSWMSAGRAFRLIQLDPTWTTATTPIPHSDGKYTYQAHWVEAEQRRRTFWFAYCLDRFISLRNGSSPTFSERVPVRLPCPDPAFQYGHPIMMDFLPDINAIASSVASKQGIMSTFGYCIVVATVAGHVLSHRHRAVVNVTNDLDGQALQMNIDFWDRHAWLDSLIAYNMGVFAMHHPPAAQEQDPMLLFLAMAWHAVTLYLWSTAENIPALAKDQKYAVGVEFSQQVEGTTHEMLRLMGKLSGMNSWKIHPLTTIPISLCAELLTSRPDLLAAFTQKLKEISKTTHRLGLLSAAGPWMC
ncbi:fungal-specific transcription factor domain-containing protein [Hypoxylon trugodes]|uniref:fungal-specific transcription factor domain-containing protein n=1 Tax=Hypoxylon trugodes TaxID=326681 RepID=UPI002199DC3D|nr:fungal-specific transcription factor domain-containing protein [Hypoxylon trugodes]KAI1390588.1 fungal-specific transcription factor domain-containing protein [Hypoxylon trugodes]